VFTLTYRFEVPDDHLTDDRCTTSVEDFVPWEQAPVRSPSLWADCAADVMAPHHPPVTCSEGQWLHEKDASG
jgi:hypothetical protein